MENYALPVVYARAKDKQIFTDPERKRACGAFPFEPELRAQLKPFVTREVEAHGLVWEIKWSP